MMVFSLSERLRFLVLLCCLLFGLSNLNTYAAWACSLPPEDLSRLKERIEFAVKWSFIPLVDTHMETYQLKREKESTFYRLTHQAAMNSFWNDRIESVVNSNSLLPCQMETIIKDGEEQWKESVIFDRHLGTARFLYKDRRNGGTILNVVDIDPMSMDPLSAFYYLRKRLSPKNPFLELRGITGSGRFSLRGKLVGEESIDVPAGTFKTYRFECSMEYWPEKRNGRKGETHGEKQKSNAFTLWVSQDDHRFPVQIRYRLVLGSLWVRAVSVQYYDSVS